MPGSRTKDNILKCPRCKAENRLFATFCISCGEPFGVSGAPDSLSSSFSTWGEGFQSEPTSEKQERIPTVGKSSVARRLARRETIIGVLIIVLAIGYAIYQWQRNTAESAAYRAGLAAQQANDWDKAADAFDRAGDYIGAANLALNAHFQANERDRLYVGAIGAAESKDWNTAISDLEKVQKIQPGFADTYDRLVQARSQAFGLQLDGLVYQVNDGSSPGLYLLDHTGRPSLLPGSDHDSAIRAASTDGTSFVYDRPKLSSDRVPVQLNNGNSFQNWASAGLENRIPVLATIEGDLI